MQTIQGSGRKLEAKLAVTGISPDGSKFTATLTYIPGTKDERVPGPMQMILSDDDSEAIENAFRAMNILRDAQD